MKWFLVLQVIAHWPASPQQLQVQGPFDDKSTCEQIKDQFDTFAITSKCISIAQGPQK